MPRLGTRAELAFDLAPAADGGTRLTQRFALRQAALPAWIFRRLVFGLSAAEMTARIEAQ